MKILLDEIRSVKSIVTAVKEEVAGMRARVEKLESSTEFIKEEESRLDTAGAYLEDRVENLEKYS